MDNTRIVDVSGNAMNFTITVQLSLKKLRVAEQSRCSDVRSVA